MAKKKKQTRRNSAESQERKLLKRELFAHFQDIDGGPKTLREIFDAVSEHLTIHPIEDTKDKIQNIDLYINNRFKFHSVSGGSLSHAVLSNNFGDAWRLVLDGKNPVYVLERYGHAGSEMLKDAGIRNLIVRYPEATGHISKQMGLAGASVFVAPCTDEEWGRLSELAKNRTEVTLNSCAGNGAGVFEGLLNILPGTKHGFTENFNRLYALSYKKLNLRRTKFRANIDAIEQVKLSILCGADGIGLVRTEHLALHDPVSKENLCLILAGKNKDNSAYAALKDRQYEQIKEIFKSVQENRKPSSRPFPVCIRLLDAPPEEFLDRTEVEELKQTYGEENLRGVQMADIRRGLYKNQIDAVFDAFAGHRRIYGKDSYIALEIMVPTVKNVKELERVKKLVEESAARHGFGKKDYKFGTMIETIEAVKNARKLAPLVDFASVGSNDLSGAVLGYIRSAGDSVAKYINPKTGSGDPRISLHSNVLDVITNAYRDIKDVKSGVEFRICGDQAGHLDSLVQMLNRAINLDSISLPATNENFHTLRMYYNAACYRADKAPRGRVGKPSLAAPNR